MKDEERIVSTVLSHTNGCRWKCVISRHDTKLSKKCVGYALHMEIRHI